MKTDSTSFTRLTHRRTGEIMDTLVLMLAASLLCAWILGTLYLTFFPAGASAAGGADSQTVAATDVEESSSDPTANGEGPDGGSSMAGGSGFTDQQKTALEEKISTLEGRLESKSQELDQLNKTSMESAKANVDTSKFENQIAQLTQQRDRLTNKVTMLQQKGEMGAEMSDQLSKLATERDQLKMQLTSIDGSPEKIAQLDQEIKRLNNQSTTQQTTIQTLKDQLAAAANSNPANPAGLAEITIAEDNLPAIGEGSDTRQNQPLEFRDWISSKGNKARLAFVGWEDGGIIVINEANKKFRLTLNRLSPQDQIYVNGKR